MTTMNAISSQNTARNADNRFARFAKDIPLVVNWHCVEFCNYSCQGCYSKWNLNDVWNNPECVRKVIENIARFHAKYFGEGALPWRLSIVGGEPILFQKKTQFIVETAVACGAEVSIISNGSFLENAFPFAHLLSQVGVSLDSFNHETNRRIGRCQRNGRTLSFEDVSDKLASLRAINPNLRVKVNTVVNQNNFAEVLVDKVAALGVSKYKILRQMPFGDCKGVTDEQFYQFVRNNYREDLFDYDGDARHIFVEDNQVMSQSYCMISPAGTLFQNGGAEYRYSRPLMDIPFETALQEVGFAKEKFFSRYETTATDTIIARMHEVAA